MARAAGGCGRGATRTAGADRGAGRAAGAGLATGLVAGAGLAAGAGRAAGAGLAAGFAAFFFASSAFFANSCGDCAPAFSGAATANPIASMLKMQKLFIMLHLDSAAGKKFPRLNHLTAMARLSVAWADHNHNFVMKYEYSVILGGVESPMMQCK